MPSSEVRDTCILSVFVGEEFVVVTGHRSLEWLQRMKGDNSRLTYWSLNLQPYQFEVQYRPGKRTAMQMDSQGCGAQDSMMMSLQE